MDRMTRDEMAQVLREGGSVELNGRMIFTEAALPTEAELAVGNPAQEAATLTSLQAQMAALQAQMALVTPAAPEKPAREGAK